MCTDPIIELVPPYREDRYLAELSNAPGTGCDLPGMNDEGLALFKALAGCDGGLVNPGWKLYLHQTTMLRESLSGNPCVITSGTGSGKTESFLLPILASICNEA